MSENDSTEKVRKVKRSFVLDDRTVYNTQALYEQMGLGEKSLKKLRDRGLRPLDWPTNDNLYLGSHILQVIMPVMDKDE